MTPDTNNEVSPGVGAMPSGMVSYVAQNLSDIADFFDTLASDQLSAKRWQSTQKAKRECEIRASVWTDAAAMLRETTIGEPRS